MASVRCVTCAVSIESGKHCTSCAGNASTMLPGATERASAVPAARSARKNEDPLIGAEVIGQYVIRAKLGKGGMGAVYLADQPSVDRRAVIKVLHPNLSRDRDVQSRFETEARAASQLNHPNIVTIYNFGAMADGTLFLAMEHLDGETLAQATAKRRLPLARVVNIACQIASALGEAHRRGVVHRDVKPTNVMLVRRDEQTDFVKVLDFGIAHIEGTRVTATGDLCGTPTYMSPEQIRGKAVDGRSDLYSLGCMLFELLTGEVPFAGETTVVLAYKHAHEEPPRASTLAPKANIPPALDAFVARALAKDPTDRPPDAAAFRDELRAAVASETTPGLLAGSASKLVKPDDKPRRGDTSVAKQAANAEATSASQPRAKADPKPLVRRKRRDTGLVERAIGAVRSRFRRRRSLAERLVTRVRIFGGRARRRRSRWPWILAASIIALSLVGVGWYVVARSNPDAHDAVQPAKSRPRAPTKPSRTNR